MSSRSKVVHLKPLRKSKSPHNLHRLLRTALMTLLPLSRNQGLLISHQMQPMKCLYQSPSLISLVTGIGNCMKGGLLVFLLTWGQKLKRVEVIASSRNRSLWGLLLTEVEMVVQGKELDWSLDLPPLYCFIRTGMCNIFIIDVCIVQFMHFRPFVVISRI